MPAKVNPKFSSKRQLTNQEEAEIQRMIASDPDAPELTDEQIAQARPFAEVFPELAESIRRSRGRPASDNPKRLTSLRLDADVVESYRALGKGWQTKVNAVLRANMPAGKGGRKVEAAGGMKSGERYAGTKVAAAAGKMKPGGKRYAGVKSVAASILSQAPRGEHRLASKPSPSKKKQTP